MFADAPEPPYVAVIFTSLRLPDEEQEYGEMAQRMDDLARVQPGYVGIEAARDRNGFGLTVSYWLNDADAQRWKQVIEHLGAQQAGRERWYRRYVVRVAVVQRQYGWQRDAPGAHVQSPS